MTTGWMEKPVLKMLHPKWFKEMEEKGEFIEYGVEPKAKETGHA